MITKIDLKNLDKLTTSDINELLDQFNISKLDLAEHCGCTLNTFYTYLTNNGSGMPQKQQTVIKEFFLNRFKGRNQRKSKKEKPVKKTTNEQAVLEEGVEKKLLNENLDDPEQELIKNLKRLNKVTNEMNHSKGGESEGVRVSESSNQDSEDEDELSATDKILLNNAVSKENYSKTECYPHIDKKFKHLSFSGIFFTPKNGHLGNALQEAVTYAGTAGVPVHVIHEGRNYKVEHVESVFATVSIKTGKK